MPRPSPFGHSHLRPGKDALDADATSDGAGAAYACAWPNRLEN